MGLAELFLAVVIVGISLVNAALPLAVWRRSHDGRFLFLAGGSLGLALLGAVWTWGELPFAAPPETTASIPVLGIVLGTAVLLLAATLFPRRS